MELYYKSNESLVSEGNETILRLPNIEVDARANLFYIVNNYDELLEVTMSCAESALAYRKN